MKSLFFFVFSLLIFSPHPIPIPEDIIVREVCPATPLQNRGDSFTGTGIILTSFDGYWMWSYDVRRHVRYILDGVPACGANCHLSRDGAWVTYLRVTRGDFIRTAYGKMRLDGSWRTTLVENVAEIEWWSDTALLVWDRDHSTAYLQSEEGWRFRTLDVRGVTSIQPSGYWGIHIYAEGDRFYRELLELRTRVRPVDMQLRVDLGESIRYFNAGAWSMDGQRFAFVAPIEQPDGALSGELFFFNPQTQEISQATWLTDHYGAIRIGGLAPSELSWSPDGIHLAFWVIPLGEDDPEEPTQAGKLHILNTQTGDLRVYCGYEADRHTPNPPKLRWSPDGTYLAFGGNPPNDNRGALLMALEVENGVIHILSAGLASTFGNTDVIAWGILDR